MMKTADMLRTLETAGEVRVPNAADVRRLRRALRTADMPYQVRYEDGPVAVFTHSLVPDVFVAPASDDLGMPFDVSIEYGELPPPEPSCLQCGRVGWHALHCVYYRDPFNAVIARDGE